MAENHAETKRTQENSGDSSDQQKNERGPKTMWTEVVGKTPEEAEKRIKEDMPVAQFQVIPPDSMVTMDFNHGRVRLFLDSSGKVARPPRIG